MNVNLPNGQVLYGVPDDISQKDAASLAIGQGIASLSDFPELFPDAELPKPEGDDDPTILENVGGVVADLGIGTMRATKSLVDLAAIPMPAALEPYTTDKASAFFERGIEATEWIKPEAYKEAQKQSPIKKNAEGEFEGFQLPSWQSVAGITAGSLPQIPSFLVGGGAAIKGLKGVKWLAEHPKFAEAIGYGIVNASLVAPGQWRETYKEALATGVSDEEAREAADAAALLTAAVSGTTGALGGAVASRMGEQSNSLAGAMAKGFVAEAPFEGFEEAGQSAASDIGMGRDVSGINALEAGTMGFLGGGVPGMGIAGLTHVQAGGDAANVSTAQVQEMEQRLRADRIAERLAAKDILTKAYEQGRGTHDFKPPETIDPMEWARDELSQYDIDLDEYLELRQAAMEEGDPDEWVYDPEEAREVVDSWVDEGWISEEAIMEVNDVLDGRKKLKVDYDTVIKSALNKVNRTLYDIGKVRGFDKGDIKKISDALDIVTNEASTKTQKQRRDALNLLERVIGTDEVIRGNLQEAQDVLKAAKTMPIKPVKRTPIDEKKYSRFIDAARKRLKNLGGHEFGLSFVHQIEHVAETHNGTLLHGIREAGKPGDNTRVAYDEDGKFVYDDRVNDTAYAIFNPRIGRIFMQIDKQLGDIDPDSKEFKTELDRFMNTLDHETVHAFRSADLFTQKEWDVILQAAKNQKKKDSDQTYYEWAVQNYKNQDGYGIEEINEEAVAEFIGQQAQMTEGGIGGLPRNLINRIKVFITQIKSALKGAGYRNFQSIVHDFETGKIGKRERGKIRTLKEIQSRGWATRAVYDNDQKLQEMFSDLRGTLREADYNIADEFLSGEQISAMGHIASVETMLENIDHLDSQTQNQIRGKAADMIQRFHKTADKIGVKLNVDNETETVLASRRPNRPNPNNPNHTFNAPDEYTRGKQVIWKLQDRLVGLKDIETAINEARAARGQGELSALESAYIGEELSHGKIGEKAREFEDGETKPLIEAISNAGLKLADLDEFLVLRHAIERNAQIEKVNPGMKADTNPGAGSLGTELLTDQYVKDRMRNEFGLEWNDTRKEWQDAAGQNGTQSQIWRLAKQVDDIVKGTLNEAYEGELLNQQERDFLMNGNYKYYTPLRGFGTDMLQEIDFDSDRRTAGTGGSISILGKQTQRAKGRSSEAYSPLATLIADRERTIARAAKNKYIGRRIYDLVQNNPNSDVWEIIGRGSPRYDRQWDNTYTYVGPEPSLQGKRKRDFSNTIDPNPANWVKQVKGVALERPMNANADELIGVKVDGEQYFIDIKDDRLRQSLLNLDQQSQSKIINTLGNVNRFLSFVNTTLNPEFVIGNFSRDIQTAIASIINEKTMEGGMLKDIGTKKITRQVIKGLPRAGRLFYKNARGKPLSQQENQDILDFLKAGARADWFHSKPPAQVHQNIQRMYEIATGTFKGNSIRRMQAIKDFVEDGNAAVENAVRFSTFLTARQEFEGVGLSREEATERAASMAKNMTINFNRKGESGNLLNSMYLFFNAQVQGTAVILRGITSPTKQKIIGGIVAMGTLMSMLHEFAEDEDEPDKKLENVPDFVRERNMIVPNPLGDEDIKIPLPYGYNFFYQLGSNAYLMARGKMKLGKGTSELAHTFLGSFNPVGAPAGDDIAASALRLGTPTAFTPIVEIATNKNYFGSPIYKEQGQYNTPVPDSHRTFKNTDEVLKSLMQGINELTGGNSSESGAIDVSPDTISYLIGYGLGGAGAFGERMWMKPAGRMMKGKTPYEEYNDVPFVRRFIHEYTDRPDMESFYDRRDRINQKWDHVKKLQGAEKGQYQRDNIEYIRFKQVYDQAEKQLKVLRQQQRQIDSVIEMNPERGPELAANQERIEEAINRLIDRVNELYEEKVEGYEEE